MKMKIITPLIAIATLLAVGGWQDLRAGDDTLRGQLSAADYKFVTAATEGGTKEVEASKIAVEKATSPAVRDFAQHMVEDHQKANTELSQLVAQKGAKAPEAADLAKDKSMMKLGKFVGAEFDKTYMKCMVSDHEATVKLFEKEVAKGSDTELKDWASKTLPNLQHHLQMAKETSDSLTVTAQN